ncbi:MAG: hypothetical protein HY678_02085 [Chloroflexi bacterium]|nr:hypothetical protein [Chloroflexota bacterium]
MLPIAQRHTLPLVLVTLPVILSAAQGGPPEHDASKPADVRALKFFEDKVRPVLAENCFGCHGSKKQKGGLRLDSAAAILKGGESGPALQPGKPGDSLVIKAVKETEQLKMAPGM